MNWIGIKMNPSSLFEIWCSKYPDDYITKRYGGNGWQHLIGSAGHFVNALFEGDLKEAFCRADFEYLKKLQDLVGKTKAEYLVDIGFWERSARSERYIHPETGEII